MTIATANKEVTSLQASLAAHQIKPQNGFALYGDLLGFEASEFQKNLRVPLRGTLHVLEQGADLSIIAALFHKEKPEGMFEAPFMVRKPVFSVLPAGLSTKGAGQ